ncbi:TPA: restriction endonuclease subunit S [Vibrio parahaemolyticus]|uniref:restriction endonuclease subunit S n=1 Tax=Vibrio parahaemolyticus TaxID=670 RepID=UPI00248FB587|nr:restriction endonuclease subunit S [Vibrio parahaemolyticus]HCE1356405.1 restriction endonuclease subunit S [Vibrio parahaemolyticus]
MKSHYKRIGDYVTQIKLKNTDDSISSLKGININKHFMPSVANINGTDLSKYRVVKKNQFAFNPMHVGRDEVLPISMLEDDEPIIVSPAYVVFEVKDEEKLLPEYLMMWCRRSEFDRNAWFMTDNSVRGGFSWADFCDMELPVPSIEKQREIVREYNVVNDRIALNEQLTQKLEDTAQALYKQWFVDFEFPISKEYAESIGKPELEGKPYKSSGGEMEFCEELEQDIPFSWKLVSFGELLKEKGYIRGPFGSALKKDDMVEEGVPVYEQQHAIGDHRNFRYFVSDSKFNSLKRFQVKVNDFVISCSGTIGSVTLIRDDDPLGIINQALLILRLDEKKCNKYLFKAFLESKDGKNKLVENSVGSAQVNIAKREVIQAIALPLPEINVQDAFAKSFKAIESHHRNLQIENDKLSLLVAVILSKMSKA